MYFYTVLYIIYIYPTVHCTKPWENVNLLLDEAKAVMILNNIFEYYDISVAT